MNSHKLFSMEIGCIISALVDLASFNAKLEDTEGL